MKPLLCATVIIILLSSSSAFGQEARVQEAPVVPGVPQSSEPRVTLVLKETPIREAFEQLFSGSGKRFVMDQPVQGVISMQLTEVPFGDALRTLATSAGLVVRLENGIYRLSPDFRMSPAGAGPRPAPTGNPALQRLPVPQGAMPGRADPPGAVNIRPLPPDKGEKRFDITLNQANLLEALRQILDLSSTDYIIDLGPQFSPPFAPRVTARLRNATISDIFRVLLPASGLGFEKTANTYLIRPLAGGAPGYGPDPRVAPGVQGTMASPCPRCSRPCQHDWAFCPHCGQKIERMNK